MKGLIFCVFVIMMLTPARGEEEEQLEQLVESVVLEQEEEYLECFRCDLGFWDACYTTETNCSRGELCYTGRGRAADALDVKTLGCVKAEECDVETTVELRHALLQLGTNTFWLHNWASCGGFLNCLASNRSLDVICVDSQLSVFAFSKTV